VTAIHIRDDERPLDYSAAKSGDFYDRCPYDACIEVDASHRNEGKGDHESAHEWSIYSADRRSGGCGGTWTRTNAIGAQRRNGDVKGLTQDAQRDRAYSLPSQAYQDQYERIFGHA
jgi:hypothetical protein